MTRVIPALLIACLAAPALAAAQPLGTFRWQLSPYCNVVTFAVTQLGSQYRFEGYDDQCGAAVRAPATGLGVANADGTLELGFTIVTANGPSHLDVTFSIGPLGGPWRDSSGATGSFAFFPSGTASGAPRPAPAPLLADESITTAKLAPGAVDSSRVLDGSIAAADINTTQVQRRVSGACGIGQFLQTVHADGTVGCGADADTNSGGTITGVNPGTGLSGGGPSGAVSLSVNFAGSGAAVTAARSDHTHSSATNTMVGASALASVTTGAESVAVGTEAMQGSLHTTKNTAVGYHALKAAPGNPTLALAQFGSNNTAVGWKALAANTDGNENVAVGVGALMVNTTGSNNTAIGRFALDETTSGYFNVAVGDNAMNNNETGYNNVAIGHQAGYHLTGHDNIAIGGNTTGVAGENNTLRIGSAPYQTATFIAGINGVTSASGTAVFVNASGRLGTATSSARFKEDIRPLGDVRAQVQALNPVSFFYTPAFDDGNRVRQYGLVAEEVEAVLPGLVVHDEHGRAETVRYHFLPALLLAEVQRLERDRTALAAQVAALAARVEALTRTATAR